MRAKLSATAISALVIGLVTIIVPTSSSGQDWLKKGTKQLESLIQGSSTSGLTQSEMIGGLKDALRVGTQTVIKQVSKTNGFNNDPAIHIPLPKTLAKAKKLAATVGLDGELKKLELKMNRGAERASKEAQRLFFDAIKQITFADAKRIIRGPDDAATQYFKGKMETPLRSRMRPIVDKALNEVGAVRSYNDFASQYQSIPFAPKLKTDLVGHVLGKATDGIFLYVAREEKAIRNNPVKRTTALLKKVFAK